MPPLVSCLMPVSAGRRRLAEALAIPSYLQQTWLRRELLIADFTGELAGVELPASARLVPVTAGDHDTQLRALVAAAKGELCARWDDDDWYAPERLEAQARALELDSHAGLCVIDRPHYVDLRSGARLRSRWGNSGNTFAFRREAFERQAVAGDAFRMTGPAVTLEQPGLVWASVHAGCHTMDQEWPFDEGRGTPEPPGVFLDLIGPGFALPQRYRSRSKPFAWDGDPAGITCQPRVYELAEELRRELKLSRVVDLGVGDGQKQRRAFGTSLDYVGVDCSEAALRNARGYSPKWLWVQQDLELLVGKIPPVRQALAVCADVLEHLVRPDRLLRQLREAAAIVLTTPDRERLYGGAQWGPPDNKCHVREWTAAEFKELVESYLGRTHEWAWGWTKSTDQPHGGENTILGIGRRRAGLCAARGA